MTTPKNDLSTIFESVESDHCSFCRRPYVHWEFGAAGLKSDGNPGTAGVCCVDQLKTVLALHIVMPPTAGHVRGALNMLEAASVGLEMKAPAVSASAITHLCRVSDGYVLSPTAGSYTPDEIVALAEQVPRAKWPDEVHRAGGLARKQGLKLRYYRWPDGIQVMIGTKRTPSNDRLIAGYRRSALSILNSGGDA